MAQIALFELGRRARSSAANASRRDACDRRDLHRFESDATASAQRGDRGEHERRGAYRHLPAARGLPAAASPRILVAMPMQWPIAEPDADRRARVLALLRRHGWNATSFQVLEEGFSYWFGAPDACVAYVDTGGAWVAAGAPIAAESQIGDTARAFVAAAARAGRKACFFATERRFVDVCGFEHLLIGQQPVWDPREWGATLRDSRGLREQLRRARAKGVRVSSASPAELGRVDAPLRVSLERLIARWQRSKALPPMGFLVGVEPFEFAAERRLFVARIGEGERETIIGLSAVVPVYARHGWFVEDLIRAPDAPNGTTELLVDAAMRDAAQLGSGYLTLGLAPLSGEVSSWLGLARKYGAPLYDFGGLRAFKAKFRPREWAPIHLSHPRTQSALGALTQSLRAFSRRGLLRYGLEAAWRGPGLLLRGAGRASRQA